MTVWRHFRSNRDTFKQGCNPDVESLPVEEYHFLTKNDLFPVQLHFRSDNDTSKQEVMHSRHSHFRFNNKLFKPEHIFHTSTMASYPVEK